MSNAFGRQPGPLNPQGLRLEDLARILSAFTSWPITVGTLEEDIDAGAPVNPDGSMNLVRYAAWLVKEAARGD
jgi:hypothetical protein